MKSLFLLLSLFFTQYSYADITCRDFEKEEDYLILRSGDVLTHQNWKTIDVVLSFDYNECKDVISQTLIKVKGEFFWLFKSTEDRCDGGNTYGSIYSYDLKTPMAHIYDGDVYCQQDWNESEKAVNHKCDRAAENLAHAKMKDFGFNFVNLSSSLELRTPYTYSFIDVTGRITNKNDRLATVRVLTNVENCEFSTISIQNLEL